MTPSPRKRREMPLAPFATRSLLVDFRLLRQIGKAHHAAKANSVAITTEAMRLNSCTARGDISVILWPARLLPHAGS